MQLLWNCRKNISVNFFLFWKLRKLLFFSFDKPFHGGVRVGCCWCWVSGCRDRNDDSSAFEFTYVLSGALRKIRLCRQTDLRQSEPSPVPKTSTPRLSTNQTRAPTVKLALTENNLEFLLFFRKMDPRRFGCVFYHLAVFLQFLELILATSCFLKSKKGRWRRQFWRLHQNLIMKEAALYNSAKSWWKRGANSSSYYKGEILN